MDQNSEDSDGKRRDINGRIDPCTGRESGPVYSVFRGRKIPKKQTICTPYTVKQET